MRVVALLLLIVYHCSILFQPWSDALGWMENDRTLTVIWIPMSMLNVWRIPILFLVSGMGVFFAMQRRTNMELLKDRALRILLPWVFGTATLGALCASLDQYARGETIHYVPEPYHLWFLLNIVVYVLLFFGVFRWIHNRPDGAVLESTRALLKNGWFVPVFALPGFVSTGLMQPEHFASYASTVHGFVYGAICFVLGFVSASVMNEFEAATRRVRWRLTVLAFGLWCIRYTELMHIPELLLFIKPFAAVESMLWMLAMMGHAFRHWSDGFPGLRYANAAVYPVYIIHQPMQNALAMFILVLPWNPWLEFGLLTAGILGFSVVAYEGVRRVNWLRPLFGMKRIA